MERPDVDCLGLNPDYHEGLEHREVLSRTFQTGPGKSPGGTEGRLELSQACFEVSAVTK